MTNNTQDDAMSSVPGRNSSFDDGDAEGPSLLDIAVVLAENLKLLIIGPVVVGLAALGVTYFIAPTFTARTTFLPPQQHQSNASGALGQLGALAGLAGGVLPRSPAEQYVALLRSDLVSDRIVDAFDLRRVYDVDYRYEARRELAKRTAIVGGKKDGLIRIDVDDRDPERAAAIANLLVDELRRVVSELALTEAQERRVFFEGQLQATGGQLAQAQAELQASGFTAGALRAEPRAAAEEYARLRAEVTAAEVRLQSLRRTLADAAPEVQQQLGTLAGLRQHLARLEASGDSEGVGADYVARFREFRYQETLFELYAKQFELARLDEAREGALIQVIDVARAPERRSRPRRLATGAVAAGVALLLLATVAVGRSMLHRSARQDPAFAAGLQRLRAALRGGR
jgi:uncharacterized protein involved in exopolysaccharide biosynthesis